jgi:hypothetical protein
MHTNSYILITLPMVDTHDTLPSISRNQARLLEDDAYRSGHGHARECRLSITVAHLVSPQQNSRRHFAARINMASRLDE